MCDSLPRRLSAEGFLLLGSVFGNGVRAVDLPRPSARYRSLPAFDAGQALPHGIPRQGGALYLADANESRDWRIYADFAQVLIGAARPLYATIPSEWIWSRVCTRWTRHHRSLPDFVSLGSVSPTQSRGEDAYLLDLHGNIPTFIRITDGKVHDVNLLDETPSRSGRVLRDGSWLHGLRTPLLFTLCSAFFVVRTKENVLLQRRYSHAVDKSTGVRSDHTVILPPWSLPECIRMHCGE